MNFHRKSTESQKCYGLFTLREEPRKHRSRKRPFLCEPASASGKHSPVHMYLGSRRVHVLRHERILIIGTYVQDSFDITPQPAWLSCNFSLLHGCKELAANVPSRWPREGICLTAGTEPRAQEEWEEDLHTWDLHTGLEQAALCLAFKAIIIFSSKWQLRAQVQQHSFWNQITRKVKTINTCFRKRENTRQNLYASTAERCPLD